MLPGIFSLCRSPGFCVPPLLVETQRHHSVMYAIAAGCVISKNPGPRLPLIGHSAGFRLATCRYIAQFEAASGAAGTFHNIHHLTSQKFCCMCVELFDLGEHIKFLISPSVRNLPPRLSINKHSVWSRIVFCGHCCAVDDLSGGRRPCCLSLSRSDSDTHTHTSVCLLRPVINSPITHSNYGSTCLVGLSI